MSDLISRQAAIDVIKAAKVKDDGTYSWRKQRNLDLEFAAELLEALPSAQPEIIRCKDCKWKQGSECVRFADVRPFPDDFCSRAERRTDE